MGYTLGIKVYGETKTPVTTDTLRKLATETYTNAGKSLVVDQGEFISGFYYGWRDARTGVTHGTNSNQATGD